MKMKPLFLLFIATLSMLITGCPDPAPVRDIAKEIAREHLGVSILSVNLLDIMNQPFSPSPSGVWWQTRYTRIFTWMKDTKTFPDIIVLQEAPGYWSCPTDARRLPDYAAIDFLLDGIRDASGEQYRIAYLIAGKPHGANGDAWIDKAPAQFCSTQGGDALLYRPSRVKNIITQPDKYPEEQHPNPDPAAGEIFISPYENPFPLTKPYLARSIQCCHPAADRADICQLIDGPLNTPKPGHYELFIGTCPTPLGVAWTRSRLSTQGEDRTRPATDAIFSRFELVNMPGNFFHIYNVHRGWNQDWEDQHGGPAPQSEDYGSQNINELVSEMENKFLSLGQPLYPPILVGDFNIGIGNPPPPPAIDLLISYFRRFEAGTFTGGIDGALFGRGAGNVPSFSSKHKAYANLVQTMPELHGDELCNGNDGNISKLWSDHCGIFFRVEPFEPYRSDNQP